MNNYKIDPSWFIGVVEDISDPAQLGRVRARAFGYHTKNKAKIPTKSLPWAKCLLPATSASSAGIVGMFLDGEEAQEPVILFSIASRSPTKEDAAANGFYDPSGTYPLVEDEIDMPLEATDRFAEAAEYILRAAKRAGAVWAPLPSVNQNTVYPNAKVRKTESGFVEVIDDTPGSERYVLQHKTGTHVEILPDGSRVTYVEGSEHVIVKGKCQIHIHGDADIQVDGATSLISEQDILIKSNNGDIVMDANAIRLNE